MPSPLLVAHGLLNTNFVTAKKVAAFNALHRMHYACDTTGGAFTVQLPAQRFPGMTIVFFDYSSNFDVANLTVSNNGGKIMGFEDSYVLNQKNQSRMFTYIDDNKGWLVR